jgi:hypothetical protein
MVSTDSCNTACKTQRLLCEVIKKLCFEKGLTDDEVNVLETDCWNHMQNIWFGAVVKELTSHLDQILKNDLDVIHPILIVTIDPNSIFCAIEKVFGETANYAKGSGSMYYDYMRMYNPKSHHYQITHARRGTRQDVGFEGSMAVFMNIPYYLEFLDWWLSSGLSGDSILMKNLLIIFQLVEMIVLFQVLTMLHVAICIPTRWLACKTHELIEFQFRVWDMGWTIDLMEDAIEKNARDGERMLDEQFMMNIFEPIVNQVEPFAQYLEIHSRKRRLMSFAHKKTSMISGYHLMSYEQNFSIQLITIYVKHMILLAAWQKLLQPHSLSSLEIQRKQLLIIYQVLAGLEVGLWCQKSRRVHHEVKMQLQAYRRACMLWHQLGWE